MALFWGGALVVDGRCNNNIDQTNLAGQNSKKIFYANDTGNLLINNTDAYGEIFFCNISNSLIRNVTMNQDDGIAFYQSNNNTLENSNLINGTYYGLYLLGMSNENFIRNNNISFNSIGINIDNSSGNIIENNTINSNDDYGIYLLNALNNSFINNFVEYNSWTGIELASSSFNNSLENNRVCNNTQLDFNITAIPSSQNFGYNNTCDKPDGWNDTLTSGCSYPCVATITTTTTTTTTTSTTTTTTTTTTTVATFNMTLQQGWNLISFPFNLY